MVSLSSLALFTGAPLRIRVSKVSPLWLRELNGIFNSPSFALRFT